MCCAYAQAGGDRYVSSFKHHLCRVQIIFVAKLQQQWRHGRKAGPSNNAAWSVDPTFTSRRDVVAFNAGAGSKGHGTRPCAHLVGRLAEAHAQATRGARVSTKPRCLTSARCHSSRTSARYRGNVRDAALKSGLFEAHALHHNPGRPQRAISKLPSARFVAQACRPMSTLCSRWRCCHCAPSRFSWACT
jgi:hypothetical protein